MAARVTQSTTDVWLKSITAFARVTQSTVDVWLKAISSTARVTQISTDVWLKIPIAQTGTGEFRQSQSLVVVGVAPGKIRATQLPLELSSKASPVTKVRATQLPVELSSKASPVTKVRATQLVVELLIGVPPAPAMRFLPQIRRPWH